MKNPSSKHIFEELVEIQDACVAAGRSVKGTQDQICRKYNLTERRLDSIIELGLDSNWLQEIDEEKRWL